MANLRLTSNPARPRQRPYFRALVVALALAVVVASCGGDSEDGDSTEELLEELEGRDLSPAEVAEREEVATLLCGLDDAVLIEVWDQLSPAELAFQDIVFSRTCPERLSLYAAETGRFEVGEDADG